MLGPNAPSLGPDHPVELGPLGCDERRHERHHDHAAGPADQLEDVVGHVPRHVAQGPGGGVGEDHRRLADLDRLPHRVVGGVAEVHEPAAPVHLPDDLFAEPGQPAVLMLAGRRVGPRCVVVVREREVAHAEFGQDSQRPERGADGMAALDTDHRRDPCGGGDPLDVVGRPGQLESIRVAADHVEERVDLLERHGHGSVRRQVRGHVDRPELAAHASCRHARQVGHEGRVRRIAALPELPQQVVVPIDEGSGAMEVEHSGRMLPGQPPLLHDRSICVYDAALPVRARDSGLAAAGVSGPGGGLSPASSDDCRQRAMARPILRSRSPMSDRARPRQ